MRNVPSSLRTETVGGALLLAAAVVALLWANSPWQDAYRTMLGAQVGPAVLHLRLDLATWAADGLLAVFFLVAGLELKRELVTGDLRDPARAALPVVAAVCGVAVPAGLYLLLTRGTPGAATGWAIPVATDIAFALAVLAVVGSHLPASLRSFLLTLAVVDDLIAITIIALFYSSGIRPAALLGAAVPAVAFGLLARRGAPPVLLVPLALATWALVHASGVHATVAGVVLAFTVPVAAPGPADALEHALRPLSAGIAVPLFALTAAGVTVVGTDVGATLRDRVVLGVVVALVAGKAVGVFGGAWLTVRLTRARLDDEVGWPDVAGVALLAGIGFTVSLLIGELSFAGTPTAGRVTVGVLLGSVLAAALACVVLVVRDRHHARRGREEAPLGPPARRLTGDHGTTNADHRGAA